MVLAAIAARAAGIVAMVLQARLVMLGLTMAIVLGSDGRGCSPRPGAREQRRRNRCDGDCQGDQAGQNGANVKHRSHLGRALLALSWN